MATTLILFTFFIYIGLGIPDSALGAVWPSLYVDLNIPVGSQSLATFLITAGTILASFFSAKLINKFGTGKVTAFSTLLTALALLGFSLSKNFIWFCVFAVPSGLGAGAIDAALNNYAATHYKPLQVNLLHCFYGIGVALSPFIFSLVLHGESTWRNGYFIIFIIQLFITILSFCALPLWKKAQDKDNKDESFKPVTLKFRDMIKMPAIRSAWFVFFFTCSLEFACDNWITTYLVNSGEITESIGAMWTSIYFVGIMSGRVLSGLLAEKLKIKRITIIGYSLIAVCIIIQFLPVPVPVKGACFFLIGLGNGPTFPNFTYITPLRFGKNYSQSIVSSQMVCANLGVLVAPILFGVFAQFVGTWFFPYYISFLFLCLVCFTLVYNARLKKYHGEGI